MLRDPLQRHFLKLEVCWQPAELIFLVSQHNMIMHDELVQRRLAWRPHRMAAISAALTWKQSILLPIGVPSWTLVGEACMRSDRAEALACQFCKMLKNSLCGGLVITLLFQAQLCDFCHQSVELLSQQVIRFKLFGSGGMPDELKSVLTTSILKPEESKRRRPVRPPRPALLGWSPEAMLSSTSKAALAGFAWHSRSTSNWDEHVLTLRRPVEHTFCVHARPG